MISPAILSDGSTRPYGFAQGLLQIRGHPVLAHRGGIRGFSTESVYIPSEDLFIAVFANSDDPPVPPVR